ncbi:phosphotransferase family protein [Frankia sp. CNm7]|uniref:Phosphotransferase family protein n=1 Tax=Frankia nepalensis TaxID=1836974 RepID=A0A937UP60_9ACTN|nr:phosphotransferase family protein [Frankia nepalensis]MBL7499264.1 phosphotransferase family protein [Frankia nepalensis]MBL7513493.1 phosphotransferase family protein [Frankia nepalensis]MBL7521344.1 phosphotransferase family protein [Frankia nepalensis]MBL7628768.1 phosphotransferase family protein [Frankia nepalensis]
MPESPVGLDLDHLEGFLKEHLELAGPLSARLIAGGRSNLTYGVTDGRRRWVVRRPPLGHVLASAHDMGREFRVLSALADSPVPVPRVVVRCVDPEVVGAEFYVMDHVDGLVIRTAAQLAEIHAGGGGEAVPRVLATTLATLHAVDPAEVGLADFGRPEGYAERQVRTWRRQLAASRSREIPGLDALADRLAAAVPVAARSGIVHGDYRLDNCMLDESLTRVAAVLDWEMATLGDPLADVGSLCMWWDGLVGLDSPTAAAPGEHLGVSSDVALTAYAAAAGWEEAELRSRMRWYLGFSYFKLAAIAEGIHFRFLRGETVGAGFDRIGAMTAPLVVRGHAALDA